MATYSFKSVGEKAESRKFKSQAEQAPLGVMTPLRFSSGKSGLFEMHYNIQNQIRDNLKNLLLTNKGERLGNFNFGADLHDLAAEKLSKEEFDLEALFRIKNAVSTYMPFIELKEMTSDTKPTGDSSTVIHALNVKYDVPDIKVLDDVVIVNIYCVG